jgi:hypothetical protein
LVISCTDNDPGEKNDSGQKNHDRLEKMQMKKIEIFLTVKSYQGQN